MRTELLELRHEGNLCLYIPVNGIYYRVDPAPMDVWARMSQASSAASRRLSGNAELTDYTRAMSMGNQLLSMLALGETLEEIRKDKPGRIWIQAAAMCAYYWHLGGFEHAKALWTGAMSNVEVG